MAHTGTAARMFVTRLDVRPGSAACWMTIRDSSFELSTQVWTIVARVPGFVENVVPESPFENCNLDAETQRLREKHREKTCFVVVYPLRTATSLRQIR